MTVIVEFTDPTLQEFVMEGPSVDYQIRKGFLIVTTDPHTDTPEKRVTFPIREVHAIFEYHLTF